MPDPIPMTLRIDPSLKAAAETTAKAQNISLTELVQRSLRSYTMPVCPTCGRSSMPNIAAPGFSKALDDFMATVIKVEATNPFVVLTEEAGKTFVYLVSSHYASRGNELANSGVLMVSVWLDPDGRKTHPIGIPRGQIIGWRSDDEGRWYENYKQQGYADGNMHVKSRLPMVPRGGR